MIRLAPLSWLPRTLCIALLAAATTPRAQSESRLEPQPEALPAGYRVETIATPEGVAFGVGCPATH